MIYIPGNGFTKIENPGKKSFNFPSSAIALEYSAILRVFLASISSMWCEKFNLLSSESIIQRITIICLISVYSFRFFLDVPNFDHILQKLYFMGVCSVGPYDAWKTRSVCDCHNLDPFIFLSFSNTKATFLALTKAPSIKTLCYVNFPSIHTACKLPKNVIPCA